MLFSVQQAAAEPAFVHSVFILFHLFHLFALNLWKQSVILSVSADLSGGEEQEAGEGVAGAAHARHHGVEPGRLQWDRVSDLQRQHRRAGGDQETLSIVTQHHVSLSTPHQLQTHLEDHRNTTEGFLILFWISIIKCI